MFPNQTPTGRVFTGLAWIHFLLNVLWTVMSLLILRTQTTRQRLTGWSHLTLTICAWDFVTVLILGVDYKNCISGYFISNAASQEMVCANGILPVLVIAAKGFVLWIMNLCLGVTLLLTTRRLKRVKMTLELS
jgi:nitrate reductase NapE component